MILRRSSRLLIAALAAAFVLVGTACGSDADDDSGGSSGADAVRNGDDDDMEDTGVPPEDGSRSNDAAPDDSGTPNDTTADSGSPDTGGGNDTSSDTGGGSDTSRDTGGGGDTSEACTFFPDSCGSGQNCYYTQQGRQCLSYQSGKSVGDDCNGVNDCGDGQVCGQDGTCAQRCDPNAQDNACSSDSTCAQLADQQGDPLPIGVCQSSCTLWPNDSCSGSMEKCVPTQSGKLCAAHQSGDAGTSCTNTTPLDCKEGLLCYQGTCTTMCTDGSRCSSSQTCQMTQQGFGLCISN